MTGSKGKTAHWPWALGAGLVTVSGLLYLLHYLIFRDVHHIVLYLIGDMAFLPVDVLLVTLILHRVLASHEKKAMLEKMNMVIGAFFSEVGTGLIRRFSSFDTGLDALRTELSSQAPGPQDHLSKMESLLVKHPYSVACRNGDLPGLRQELLSKRSFLLLLLENPILLEHDSFTDLLWAVCHLAEELAQRPSALDLPANDLAHLDADIQRAYRMCVSEWFVYMKHLRAHYVHLYSLAMRLNPFDSEATAVIP